MNQDNWFRVLVGLFVTGMLAVGTLFVVAVDGPSKLIGYTYVTVIPGILVLSLLVSGAIFHRIGPRLLASWSALSMGICAAIFTVVYLFGIFDVGVAWPVDAWRDIYSDDIVMVGELDGKKIDRHTHSSGEGGRYEEDHTYLLVNGKWWGAKASTYNGAKLGNCIEVAQKQRTKAVSYVRVVDGSRCASLPSP